MRKLVTVMSRSPSELVERTTIGALSKKALFAEPRFFSAAVGDALEYVNPICAGMVTMNFAAKNGGCYQRVGLTFFIC